MKPAFAVQQLGQSIWIDNIARGLLTSGAFKKLIDEEGITGVTSNPTIFEKAISSGADYDIGLRALVGEGTAQAEIFESLAVEDLRNAADLLRPVYERTEGGDGFVSIEVSPTLAHDTEGSIVEARRLWSALARPNVMVKIPGTREGLPAIEQLLTEGINVNITLLFSVRRYEEVMERYYAALERRLHAGEPLARIASVASFFVSRVDTAVDRLLDARAQETADEAERKQLLALRGTIAIANAKVAYQSFKERFSGDRWERLRDAGARVQRPLWASTGTKDPAYSDVLYVETLIGPHTVNTLPPQTLEAFNEHGSVALTLEHDVEAASTALRELAGLGIDLDQVTEQLEREGVESFAKSFQSLLTGIEGKRDQILGERAGGEAISLGPLKEPVAHAIARLDELQFGRRIWEKDGSLWGDDPEHQQVARNRLGWLDSPATMLGEVARLEAFAAGVRADGFTHAVLLGMGGSSLAPEVLRDSFLPAAGAPELHVLDSTDPDAIIDIEREIDIKRTLFIASSKSGTTTEMLAFLEYFWAKRPDGARFVAITDPGSALQRLAESRGFREVFLNPEDIGGRYAAISFVGMVPAALLGLDLRRFLESARRMADACGATVPVAQNAGARLGAILGAAALAGRDKLTLVCSSDLGSFAFWVEQLIAESTGKNGRGILPVEDEPLGPPEVYGDDRLFVSLLPAGDEDARLDEQLAALAEAGHPVVRIELPDAYNLGGEFFRWEMATAAAAALIEVDPFDEPNVQESKDNTKRLLTELERNGALPSDPPLLEDGLRLYAAPPTADVIRGADSTAEALARFLEQVRPGDYLAIMAYFPRTWEREPVLQEIRAALRDRLKVATTFGYGPRFLHSTGQLHKGGSDRGVFLQLTHDSGTDLPIPGAPYSFRALEQAQALGDLQALQSRGRRALRVDLGAVVDAGLQRLREDLSAGWPSPPIPLSR